MTVESKDGRVRVLRGQSATSDLVITGPADGVALVLSGRIDRAAAASRGVAITGDARKLAKLRPKKPARAAVTPA